MSVLSDSRLNVSTFCKMKRLSKQHWFLALLLLPALLGVFVFSRSLWWELRPFPDFPSLVNNPDTNLTGTVAFFDSFPDNCLHVIAASGGVSRKVKCLKGEMATWLPDGRVQVTSYADRDKSSDDTRVIVNVETGRTTPVLSASIPPWSDPRVVQGPNGEEVRTISRRGNIALILKDVNGERTLLSVNAPTSYTLGPPSWSPTGDWFIVKDGIDRLLTITTNATPTVRILAKNAWGQAVTGRSFPIGNTQP